MISRNSFEILAGREDKEDNGSKANASETPKNGEKVEEGQEQELDEHIEAMEEDGDEDMEL